MGCKIIVNYNEEEPKNDSVTNEVRLWNKL